MHGLTLTHYPNNEFRLTAYPIQGKRFFYGDENENRSTGDSTDELKNENGSHSGSTNELLSENLDVASPIDPPLSLPPNSELFPRPGFGGLPRPSFFTLNGRRQILRSAGALEKIGRQPNDSLFFTGTLPGSTSESMEVLARWSGYIVDRLKSWASKYAQDRLEFYCWEHQKRGALHLHWCISLPSHDSGEPLLRGFHKQWRKLLLTVSRKSGIDMFARSEGGTWKGDPTKPRTDAQRCEKSLAAYMAKYCSKGNDSLQNKAHSPSRWWGVSRPLLALTRSLTSEKKVVCSNINSARKREQDLIEIMEAYCEEVHTYSSHCGTFKVRVGYHEPGQFVSIKQALFGIDKMKVFELRDGSLIENNLQIRAKLDWIVRDLPDTGGVLDVKMWFVTLLDATGKTLVESEVQGIMRRLELLSFVDTGLSSLTVDTNLPGERWTRIARQSWALLSLLKIQYRELYSSRGIEPESHPELTENLSIVQLDIFGKVPVVPVASEDELVTTPLMEILG